MKTFLPAIFLSISLFGFSQTNCPTNTHSMELDGFSSYVDLQNSTSFAVSTTLTVEAWIHPSSFGFTSAQNSIFCKHGWSSGEGGYVLRCGGSGEVSFNIAGLDQNGIPTSWKEVASPANAISLSAWSHVAGTYDGDTLNLFINGSLVAQTVFQGSITGSGSYSPKIGRLADTFGGRYFSGLIDEVRVWNRELNAAEIQSRMNVHLNPAFETGLVGYWRFNEGSGTVATNLAQTGADGFVLNGIYNTNVPFSGIPFSAQITSLSGDTICANESASMQASPTGVGYSYQWNNGFINATAVTNIAGNYYVVITDGNGCSDTSNTIQLVVNPLPAAAVITQSGNSIVASNVNGNYQWYLDGAPFVDDLTISNPISGTYLLIVTDSVTGCQSSSNLITISTGIPERFSSLRIYPNPASEQLNLQQQTGSEPGAWMIFDLTGKQLASGRYSSLQQFQIPLQTFSAGMYLLKLESEGFVFSFPFAKSE